MWRREVELERRGKGRKDTEGGEKVRDTGGFITLPEIRRVSTQTVWQTNPRRRSEINQQPPSSPLTFLRKDYCGFLRFRLLPETIFYLSDIQATRSEFWTVRNLESLLPRCVRMRVCLLLVLFCLLCAGRAQKFSALTVGRDIKNSRLLLLHVHGLKIVLTGAESFNYMPNICPNENNRTNSFI